MNEGTNRPKKFYKYKNFNITNAWERFESDDPRQKIDEDELFVCLTKLVGPMIESVEATILDLRTGNNEKFNYTKKLKSTRKIFFFICYIILLEQDDANFEDFLKEKNGDAEYEITLEELLQADPDTVSYWEPSKWNNLYFDDDLIITKS